MIDLAFSVTVHFRQFHLLQITFNALCIVTVEINQEKPFRVSDWRQIAGMGCYRLLIQLLSIWHISNTTLKMYYLVHVVLLSSFIFVWCYTITPELRKPVCEQMWTLFCINVWWNILLIIKLYLEKFCVFHLGTVYLTGNKSDRLFSIQFIKSRTPRTSRDFRTLMTSDWEKKTIGKAEQINLI